MTDDKKTTHPSARDNAEDLRGAGRLLVDATKGVAGVVEAMQRTIASGPALLGRPLARPVGLVADVVYGSIRGVAEIVGLGVDEVLALLAPLLGKSAPGPEREAVLAALNGVLGDRLAETHSPLAIQMRLRTGGIPLTLTREDLAAAFPTPRPHIVVMVHGSSMTDLQWRWNGTHDHGAVLGAALDASTVYLHYNSGLHISTNGQAFANVLEELVAGWPVPVAGITLVAHSMGGLVCRSACHQGDERALHWRALLKNLVTLGAPHHGAPLERGGNWADVLLGATRTTAPLARLGQIRSAGVTDLRFGTVLEADWQGKDRFAHDVDRRHPLPLPVNVRCYALAATTAPHLGPHLPGDGLVPVDSALGRHPQAALALAFPEANTAVLPAMGHLDLVSRPEVATMLVQWLAGTPPSSTAS